ncbi:MAG: hypothetical protein AABY32_02110 [Nanoarchaeota archaeon]
MADFYSDELCKSRVNCFSCRTNKNWRRWLLSQKKVDVEDFECIPLKLAMDAKLEEMPEPTQKKENNIKRMEDVRKNLPALIQVLKQTLPSEYEGVVEDIEFITNPHGGSAKVCEYMKVTNKKVKRDDCKCKTFLVDCKHPDPEVHKIVDGVAITMTCRIDKCKWFTPKPDDVVDVKDFIKPVNVVAPTVFSPPPFDTSKPDIVPTVITSSVPPVVMLTEKEVKSPKNTDKMDYARIRHGREKDVGFLTGKYIQTPPLLFSRDCHNIWLGDMYRGGSAFLILSGPSFANVNKELLLGNSKRPRMLTLGVNNSVKTYRPDMWTCVDRPDSFIKSIWVDPGIMKFTPICHSEKFIFDSDKWEMTNIKVGDCPNVWYYRRNEYFRPENFLYEDTINWGNHSKAEEDGGGRSIMLASIRILFYLGIRNIFLLGCDFKMDSNYTYHFEQNRAGGSVNGNTSTYEKLKDRFNKILPIFKQNGLNIYNCNPDSGLKVFPFISVEEAVKIATVDFPEDLSKERTEGLYDREAKEKEKKKKESVSPVDGKVYTEEEKTNIKNKLDEARGKLRVSKESVASYKLTEMKEIDKVEWNKKLEELEADVLKYRAEFRTIEAEKNKIWGIVKK